MAKGKGKKSAAKTVKKGEKAARAAKAPKAAKEKPDTPKPATAAGTPTVRVKKKVKRGAPPMLPRRLARRPLPPALGEGVPAGPPLPPKTTTPGSLHAPARAPEGAEGLKVRLTMVTADLARLRALKRTLNKQFWDAGEILAQLSDPALYQAKGYGSWEAFLEREIERELAIGRTTVTDLVKIVRLFQREAAEELGLERLRGALRALWPEPGPTGAVGGNSSGGGLS